MFYVRASELSKRIEVLCGGVSESNKRTNVLCEGVSELSKRAKVLCKSEFRFHASERRD